MTGTGGKTMSDRRDRLYADLLADVEAFVFDDKVAAVFPDMIRRSVPGYGTVIALTGVIAARYYQPDSRIYDLGCSQGASTLSIARQLGQPAVPPATQVLALVGRQPQPVDLGVGQTETGRGVQVLLIGRGELIGPFAEHAGRLP